MAKITQDQLELLVTKAALDPAFRDKLKSTPRDAVTMLIELDDDDLRILKALASDLERFSRGSLDPIDAKSWAKGICYLRR
jgi:hypothetical protein